MMPSMFWRGLWLSVGYAEVGSADGPAVLLLYGWPYDIHSFADVTRCWPRRAT
jgi:pimeloyl-ACP methyl ester carboxylesterase